MTHEAAIRRAADAIASAEALLIGAGAGMSVDSGIPSYRLAPNEVGSPQGLLGALNPMLFTTAPELAWGRAGRQLSLFRETTPHVGYEILLRWSQRAAQGAFVVTSNVDGMFQRAGFPEARILEGHGSLHFIQCTTPCGPEVWSAKPWLPRFAGTSEYAEPPLPTCSRCGAGARPNIFMFGDQYFNGGRAETQAAALERWLQTIRGHTLTIVECGAGTAVPTIRRKCEDYARLPHASHIRINPFESQADDTTIQLPLPAAEALQRIDAA